MSLLKKIFDIYDQLYMNPTILCSKIYTGNPVELSSIESIEKELSFTFPEKLKSFYTNQASEVIFAWELSEHYISEDYKRGELRILSPQCVKESYLEMIELVHDFEDYDENECDEDGVNALVNDWSYWIPIIRFGNGDAFCIDKRDTNGKIVFLEHDVVGAGPNVHGLKMANNFSELMDKWSKIGFLDAYYWNKIVSDNGIDVDSRCLEKIKNKLNLSI